MLVAAWGSSLQGSVPRAPDACVQVRRAHVFPLGFSAGIGVIVARCGCRHFRLMCRFVDFPTLQCSLFFS